jgi:hypothetical protein
VSTIADIMRAEEGHAPYAYTDAHDHRLTLRAVLDGLGKPYVWAEAENLAFGGDITSVWLTLEQVAVLDRHLDTAVPASFTDHTGDTLTVAYSHAFTFFEVTRVADEDDEDDSAAVRVVALTGRLPEVRAAFKATAERAQQRADEYAAAQTEQQLTPPAVGDRYVKRAEPDRGRVVTVTSVWPAGDDGHTAVAYEWRDDKPGQCGSACPLGVFLGTYEPYTEPAEPDAAMSPTLRAVRDIIAATPGRDGDELAAARVLLAAHARELAELIETDIRADRERKHTGRPYVYAHRGGMMSARQRIDRYADALDAAAVDGEL